MTAGFGDEEAEMKALEPLYVTELFPLLEGKLIELLASLSNDDWHRSTICAMWDVKDIAAHLLDTNLRKLSTSRDNYFGDKPENINSYSDLVAYLNQLNADWVKAARRISPPLLLSLLEQTSHEVYQLYKTLDPHKPSLYSVAWAGEEQSENWFDLAREYTERWHHQQQIRLAVDRPGILERKLYFPVLDTFMRALPHTYRDVDAGEGALLRFDITGEAGGSWFLLREGGQWQMFREAEGSPGARVRISQDIAWRLFTKGIDKELARKQVSIEGDRELGGEVINMLSVMA